MTKELVTRFDKEPKDIWPKDRLFVRGTSHLSALELGLSHERVRLANAKTKSERELRKVWIAQREREIANEKKFLGIVEQVEISDEELLKELGV